MQHPVFTPFLVARFVLFALIFNTCLLGLTFTIWNIHATSLAKSSLTTTSILMIFTNCLSLIFVTLGLVELLFPSKKTSWMIFECIWSAVLGVLQIGVAISSTVNFSMIGVSTKVEPYVRASMALLVPSTWFSGFFLFTFFLLLIITTFLHRRVCAQIWTQSPYQIDWFSVSDTGSAIDQSTGRHKPQRSNNIEMNAEGTASSTCVVGKAPWAKAKQVRRGVDAPFAFKASPGPILPLAPSRVRHQVGSSHSRFVERYWEVSISSRQGSPVPSGQHESGRSSPFPDRAIDHNLPIPKPKMSEWIRADSL